jgi:hypothetical protein
MGGSLRVSVMLLVVTGVACGSASGADLFSDDGSSPGSGGQQPRGGSGGLATGGSSGGGPLTGGGSGGLLARGGSGGQLASGGTSGSGGTPMQDDEVTCGDVRCPTNNFCCVLDNVNPSCRGDGSECSGSQFDCDGSDDCQNGQRCCARVVAMPDGKTFLDSECRDDCPGGMTMCDGNSSCSDGRDCITSTVVPAYRVCL